MASQPIYQFHAELLDYEPKIWRRFQVGKNITMARLGCIVLTLFEMQASHLFDITVPCGENMKRQILIRDPDISKPDPKIIPFRSENLIMRYEFQNDMMDDFQDGRKEKVLDMATSKMAQELLYIGDECTLSYDYGDGWQVHLVLEKVIQDKELPARELPRVLEGEGFGIIEDCGGTGGLEELAKAFKKKKGAQYRDYCEWLGTDELDLETFEVEEMNVQLKKVPRIYEAAYEGT